MIGILAITVNVIKISQLFVVNMMMIRKSQKHPVNTSCDLMWISQHPIVRLVHFQECAFSASLCPSQLGKEPEKLWEIVRYQKSQRLFELLL